MKNLMEQKVEEHKATIDYNEPRDFIDKVLTELRTSTDSNSSFHGDQGQINLVSMLLDLFIAGSETTSTTLTWAVLFMARESEIQAKVQVSIKTFPLSKSIMP
jgi:cytochrome P450